MEAVISGQAGVALLVDGDTVSSIHVHDIDSTIARRVGEFHYLFGGATDLTFVEDASLEQVRRELILAVDGQDIAQLTLLLLASDRPEEIRETAATELSELLETNAGAASFAERLLFSTLLPADADLPGALRICRTGQAREFLERLQRMQPFVQRVKEAWRAIPDICFETSGNDSRKAADAVFVREGVFRSYVIATSGEVSLDSVAFASLQIPSVRSLANHRDIVTRWKSNLVVEIMPSNRGNLEEMLAEDASWEDDESGKRAKKRRRRGIDRQQELSRIDRVKSSIEEAMRAYDLEKALRFAEDLVREQVAKSGNAFACKSLCDLAKRAQDLGLHALQLEFATRAVGLQNDDGWSWTQYGKALLDCGRPVDALAAYDQAVFFIADATALCGRAETLRSLGRAQEALAAYEAVILDHPENVVAKSGHAETLRSLGRTQEALEAYEAIIQAHPENIFAKCGRAETLRSLGRVQDALEAYETTIQSHPNEVVAQNGRAETLRSLGRANEALEAYEEIIQAYPADIVSKNCRAETLRSLGRMTEAMGAYEAIIRAYPGDVIAKNGRAETLRSIGRSHEALSAYEAIIHAYPGDVVAKNGRAETLRSFGRVHEALNAYEAIIQAHPENIVAKCGRAETLRALGRVQEALTAYEAIMQVHPENVVAKCGLACALIALKRFDDALESLPIESPVETGDWVGFHIRGTCLLKQGRLNEAVDVFQLGVDQCPFPNQRNYFASALAVARMRQGAIEVAAQVLKDIDSQVDSHASHIQLENSPAILLVRLHVCGLSKRDAEARRLYQRLPEALPRVVEKQVKDELNHRHILNSGPQHSDDWLFEQLCDCLLAA